MSSTIKKKYLEATVAHLKDKLKTIEDAIKDTQSSANSDTKSSAGDKHETSRAMAQIENERLSNQLSVLTEQMEKLYKINPSISSEIVNFGSVVKTDTSIFFISTGLGKIKLGKEMFYAIATNSPVGINLLNKKVGDTLVVGQKLNTIILVE